MKEKCPIDMKFGIPKNRAISPKINESDESSYTTKINKKTKIVLLFKVRLKNYIYNYLIALP